MIIGCVIELAAKHGVSMTEVSLAWLLTKVTAPVVGATKLHHIEGAAKAVDLILSEDKIAYLEEPYIPHALVGVRHRIPWRRQKRSTFGLQEAKKYREKKDGKTKTMLSKTFFVAVANEKILQGRRRFCTSHSLR